MKKKYYFFFRGSLDSHVDIYLSWVDIAKTYLPIRPLTVLSSRYAKNNQDKIDLYRKNGVEVRVVFGLLKNVYVFLYFFANLLVNEQVVVHLKKQNIFVFKVLKKIFGLRLRLLVELEGDPWGELSYLSDSRKSLAPDMYDGEVRSLKRVTESFHSEIGLADRIYVVTEFLKEKIVREKAISPSKVIVKPTGFDSTKFFHCLQLRDVYRKKLGVSSEQLLLVYSGNCFYSWQNLSRTIWFFKKVSELRKENCLLVLMIREQDHWIAKQFLAKHRLGEDKYRLFSAPHKEVNGYLNACDCGVLLRESHDLNLASAPGKLGEYLAAGLNVVTTHHIGVYSEQLRKEGRCVLVDDIYCDKELLQAIAAIKEVDRGELSAWARERFSSSCYLSDYLRGMEFNGSC